MDELALHPTVKPVQMIADAIKDVSGRGDIVLDLFGGSGSTLIAAHKTGRRGYLIELDPIYCDRIIRRWEGYAKDDALLAGSGKTFGQVSAERSRVTVLPPPADSPAPAPISITSNDPGQQLSAPATPTSISGLGGK